MIGILDHISCIWKPADPQPAELHHQFVDRINNGAGRLVWIKFCDTWHWFPVCVAPRRDNGRLNARSVPRLLGSSSGGPRVDPAVGDPANRVSASGTLPALVNVSVIPAPDT